MRPRKVSDEAILAAALQALVETGGRASADTIAARLGVSQTALFKRFGSMDVIVSRALSQLMSGRDWRAVFGQKPDPARFHEQLGDIAKSMLEFTRCSLTAVEVMRGRVAFDKVEELLSRVGLPSLPQLTQDLEEWLALAAAAGLVAGARPALGDAFLGGLYHRFILEHMRDPAASPLSVDPRPLIELLFPHRAPPS